MSVAGVMVDVQAFCIESETKTFFEKNEKIEHGGRI